MKPQDLNRFQRAFEALRASRNSELGPTALVDICKTFDLRLPELRWACDEIASWIASDSPDVRREVVFALCSFRPVSGYEGVLAPAWRLAPPDDLHWYAAAIENACSSAEQVPRELVCTVTSTLLIAPPTQPEDAGSLDVLEASQNYRLARSESARALRHLASVVLPELAWAPEAEIDWECVARLLHWSCCRRTAAVPPPSDA